MSNLTATHTATHHHRDRVSIFRLVCLLSTFTAITFIFCVIAGYFLPAWRGLMPVTVFPGFSWESPLTAIPGVIWSIGFGAYVAALFGLLYNAFGGVRPSHDG